VFGRNLLDQGYASNALDFRPFSGLILQPGDPLCLGVGINAKFWRSLPAAQQIF